ncbi:MAG: NADH:ubiquinone reductase (Na(+)-transporting) subunit F [Bacteroidaceae bacterium]|nr:NADH:ubiquinone reductase (Na(+)-transporting) subunit F [Candidatus Minthousia equi]MCQ2245423.1 NADH:ubiquinone reductase (Na(+)-transporting) subunit F [Bacteroidaceae bacterium]MDO4957043.1 NADH:ubiquinone reductase (Na(+)-transporting) subunit F [Bacteroidales bacterium]
MDMNFILASIGVFLVVILVLVVILLVAKNYLSPSGPVKVTINGENTLEVESGSSLLSTLAVQNVYLPSACGGKGACGQCKCQVVDGGGEILPSEKGFFSRKEQKDHWRLGCQVKVKGDMAIKVDDSVMGVKEWECTVIGNKNVATFIKEYKVALPPGEHMDFEPGSYAQIKIPAFEIDYKDFDKSLIGDTYLPAWEKFGLFPLHCSNTTPTIRAYSMANYPDEGDIITLNVRIATPPFKPKDQGPGFMDVNPGIASSYIFSLKPGDKVIMSGPYGEFRPVYGSGREMIWVGGGAGMAPLRAQIMHMLKGNGIAPEDRNRPMHYFYGARALEEIPFLDDFLQLEKDFPNFHFHLALDRPDPKADAAGIKYTPGFVAPVMGDTYLKQHEAPEDCEYYLCGPPMMAKTVLDLLHSLGVEDDMIRFDNFGG